MSANKRLHFLDGLRTFLVFLVVLRHAGGLGGKLWQVRRLPFLAAALLLVSCSANRMYRTASLEEYPRYSLAFIEFDDQGELWAPSQVDRALAHLERLNQNESGVALMIFAHGWNASAAPGQESDPDSALSRFKAILARLDRGIEEELPELELPIMGVYLGWRGRVSSVPLVRQASFYNRRGAAERIAGVAATEAIYRLLTALRENPASRSVLIGHSFGSLILERALAQAVISALLAAEAHELVFPADLVVLFNPAGSATRAKQLVDILARNRLKTYRYDRRGKRFERPLLVSFTSESDRATRVYFPAGMFFKAASKKFRNYGPEHCSPISNQRRLYTHTAGHLPELHSHEVTVSPKRSGPGDGPPLASASYPDRMIPYFMKYEEVYDPLSQQMTVSFDGVSHRFTIKRKPLALNDTPYWIMQVPRELIPNHSAVLTEDTFRLVEAILALSGTYDVDVPTIVDREDGVRPVAVVPRLEGKALYVDRDRGVYAVSRDSRRPIFVTCLTEDIDPDSAIGFHVAGHLAYAVLMTGDGDGANDRCQTELYQFQVGDEGYRLLLRKRLAGSSCFSAAAVDLPGQRVLLSLTGEQKSLVLAADLGDESPRPEPLLELPGSRAATTLHVDAGGGRLFAAQGVSGELWEIDLASDAPSPRRIDGERGWPVSLAYARTEQRLYVTDAKNRKIWFYDCEQLCGEPEVFLESAALENPTTLAIALDGTLWLGDLEGQTLTAIAPDGRVENKIYSLSGVSPSSETGLSE